MQFNSLTTRLGVIEDLRSSDPAPLPSSIPLPSSKVPSQTLKRKITDVEVDELSSGVRTTRAKVDTLVQQNSLLIQQNNLLVSLLSSYLPPQVSLNSSQIGRISPIAEPLSFSEDMSYSDGEYPLNELRASPLSSILSLNSSGFNLFNSSPIPSYLSSSFLPLSMNSVSLPSTEPASIAVSPPSKSPGQKIAGEINKALVYQWEQGLKVKFTKVSQQYKLFKNWITNTELFEEIRKKYPSITPEQIIYIKQEFLFLRKSKYFKNIIEHAFKKRDFDILEKILTHISHDSLRALLELTILTKKKGNRLDTTYELSSILTTCLKLIETIKNEDQRKVIKLFNIAFNYIKDAGFPVTLIQVQHNKIFNVLLNRGGMNYFLTHLAQENPFIKQQFITQCDHWNLSDIWQQLVEGEKLEILKKFQECLPEFLTLLMKKNPIHELLEKGIGLNTPKKDECLAFLIKNGHPVIGDMAIISKKIYTHAYFLDKSLNEIYLREDLKKRIFSDYCSSLYYALSCPDKQKALEDYLLKPFNRNIQEKQHILLWKTVDSAIVMNNSIHEEEYPGFVEAIKFLIGDLIKKGLSPILERDNILLLEYICTNNVLKYSIGFNNLLKHELIDTILPFYQDIPDQIQTILYTSIFESHPNWNQAQKEQRFMKRYNLSVDKRLHNETLKCLLQENQLALVVQFSKRSSTKSLIWDIMEVFYLSQQVNIDNLKVRLEAEKDKYKNDYLTSDLMTYFMNISAKNPKSISLDALKIFINFSLRYGSWNLQPAQPLGSPNILENFICAFSCEGTQIHYEMAVVFLNIILYMADCQLSNYKDILSPGGNLTLLGIGKAYADLLDYIIKKLNEKFNQTAPENAMSEMGKKVLRLFEHLMEFVKFHHCITEQETNFQCNEILEYYIKLHFIKVLDSSPIALQIPKKLWGGSTSVSLMSIIKDLYYYQVKLASQHGLEIALGEIKDLKILLYQFVKAYYIETFYNLEIFRPFKSLQIADIIQDLQKVLETEHAYKILPGGYSLPIGGHFVLYLIQKEIGKRSFSFTILNSGEGTPRGIKDARTGKTKVYDICFTGLTLKELSSEFFTSLLNFRDRNPGKHSATCQANVFDFIFTFFQKTQPSIEIKYDTTYPHAFQKQPSCTLKSITPLLHRIMGKKYWSFKFFSTHQSNMKFQEIMRTTNIRKLFSIFGLPNHELIKLAELIKNENDRILAKRIFKSLQ